MTNAGLPVPPGFTVTTAACNLFVDRQGSLPRRWTRRSKPACGAGDAHGQAAGDAADPLLVSVRSGAKFSMPGMMDTILNLG
jgi:pyruvate,orthophosphate dikinase